jgi:hypothetical protein
MDRFGIDHFRCRDWHGYDSQRLLPLIIRHLFKINLIQ